MNSASVWSVEYLLGRWQPGFHDDHVIGWLITGSYLACAMLAFIYATFLNQREKRRAYHFWLAVGVLMTLLGINKQLALQMLLTEMGRQVARAQGWYEYRRIVQFTFIIIFVTTFSGAFVWFARSFRDLFRRYLLAFCGLFFLLTFVFIRASAFHHVDEIIQYDLHGITLNWVLELTGIYLIILAGLKELVVPSGRIGGGSGEKESSECLL
jgi:hypothetical protein